MKKAEGAERSIKANGGSLFPPFSFISKELRLSVSAKSLRFIFFFPPFSASKWVFKRHLLIHFLCASLMLSFYLQKYVLSLAFCFDWYYDKSLFASR